MGSSRCKNLLNASSTPPALDSISYGECEAENGATANAAFNTTYQQAATEGVSMFVASGDEGAASCDADLSNATHGIGVSGFTCTGAPSNWSGAGGTSFASPIMAGIQALVTQKWGRQGNPNPTYYAIAKTEYGTAGSTACNSTKGKAVGSSCIFYDVTQGNMDVNCSGTHNCYKPSGTYGILSTSTTADDAAYGTKTGWDFAPASGR